MGLANRLTLIACLTLSACTTSITTPTLWNQYQSYPEIKAFAVGSNGISAAAWAQPTIEQAIHSANTTCTTYGGINCEVIDVNGGPPPHASPPANTRPSPIGSTKSAGEPRVVRSGTGFFVTEDFLVTNEHVIASCDKISVSQRGGVELQAELVSSDPQNDLAVLEADRESKLFSSFRGRSAKQGEKVFVYGYPLSGVLSAEPKITEGIINSTAGLSNDIRFFQFSAQIQPGSSGAPLIADDGNVVGIVTSTLNSRWAEAYTGNIPQDVNFAVKSLIVIAFLDSVGAAYKTGAVSGKLTATAVAAEADTYTFQVSCWES